MDNLWMLYLVTRLDSVSSLFVSLIIVGSVATVLFGGVAALTHDSCNTNEREVVFPFCKKMIKTSLTVIVVSMLLKTFIPTKEDAMFIAGGVVLTEIAQGDEAQCIASGSVRVVEAWLAKQEAALKEQTKGENK